MNIPISRDAQKQQRNIMDNLQGSERSELIAELEAMAVAARGVNYEQHPCYKAAALLAEDNGGEVVANKYAEFWERLPGHLIDNYEGEELTEELLQRAAAELYEKFPDFVASGLKPFGLLLLEERATTRQLNRALREATEPPTFMGEPVTHPQQQAAQAAIDLDEVAGFCRAAFGYGAADFNAGVDALLNELKRRGLSAAPEQAAAPQGWKLATEEMPPVGIPVLANTGQKYPIRACWVPKFSQELGASDFQGDEDYDEKTDTSYWPEGWYEWNRFEETHWRVDVPVVHWMPLPAAPGAAPVEKKESK